VTGRIAIREGELADEPGVYRAAIAGDAGEDALRDEFRAAVATAAEQGVRVVALPVPGTAALSLQRRAEVLLAEARRALAPPAPVDEIRFVVAGEPAFRVFESVQDAARIAEQMERLGRR
jgi:O-acetyl-ADP-ribose deacetylase (regulator of RNase III)